VDPEETTVTVVEAMVEAGPEVASSAASSAECEASCSGVGAPVGSGTPSGQCLDIVSLDLRSRCSRMVLPVVAVGLALTTSSHRDGVLCYDGGSGSEERDDREPHVEFVETTVVVLSSCICR